MRSDSKVVRILFRKMFSEQEIVRGNLTGETPRGAKEDNRKPEKYDERRLDFIYGVFRNRLVVLAGHMRVTLERMDRKTFNMYIRDAANPVKKQGGSGGRTGYRKGYSEQKLQDALDQIQNHSMSVRRAAILFQIPRNTINYRLSERYKQQSTSGTQPIFSKDEEALTAQWLQNMRHKGFSIYPKDLQDKMYRQLVANPRPNPFKRNRPGKTWRRLFFKKHPELEELQAGPRTRLAAVPVERDVRHWFSSVHDYFSANNLVEALDDASRVVLAYEKCFNQNGYSVHLQSDYKKNLTLLHCISPDGHSFPPNVILDSRQVSTEALEYFPSWFKIDRCNHGSLTAQNLAEWIKEKILPSLNEKHVQFPVIMFLEDSSAALEAAEIFLEFGLILVALYPCASQFIQRSKVGIVRSLERNLATCAELVRQEGDDLSLSEFATVLQQAIEDSAIELTIECTFRNCGIFPFDEDAVDYSKCV